MGRGIRRTHTVDPFGEAEEMSNKELLLILCQLNKPGLNMLEHLVRDGYVYKGRFLISPKDFLKSSGLIAKKSFYLGIDNLVKWNILAKSDDVSFFYFNPKIFAWHD
tara:strand:+ start:1382 stop:1702 length:321 start_codon:yes stop_codon:yes gene_type:complete